MTATTADVSKLSRSKVRDMLAQAMGRPTWVRADEAIALLGDALAGGSGATLSRLLADLEMAILSPEPGPLSFRRLAELDPQTASEFEGKTFLHALTSSKTTKKALQALAYYGELLTQADFPEGTKLTGMVINTLASAVLAARHGEPLGDTEARMTEAVLGGLSGNKAVPNVLRETAIRSGGTLGKRRPNG